MSLCGDKMTINHNNLLCLFLIAPFIWLQELPLQQLEFKNLPLDSSGQYKIQRNFLVSKIHQNKGQQDVILVTHCTPNHLHYILDLSVHWKGPISLGMKMANSFLLLERKVLENNVSFQMFFSRIASNISHSIHDVKTLNSFSIYQISG